MSRPVLPYPFPADMPPPTRQEAADMIDGLIEYLDSKDGDPDFEDEGTAEPAMAALVGGDSQIRWAGFDGRAA